MSVVAYEFGKYINIYFIGAKLRNMQETLTKITEALYDIWIALIPQLAKLYSYAKLQPWFPGVRFLAIAAILTWVILKMFFRPQKKKSKKRKSTRLASKVSFERYIYNTGDEHLMDIPQRYTKHSTKFISCSNFLKHWATVTDGSQILDGYKKRFATSGCYLILISDEKSSTSTIINEYTEIYAGQSVNIAERVHQHFTGHGNGDVYADVKYGKYVFVKLFPCPKENMNDLECRLIEAFNGLDSYNKTAGGAQKRKRQSSFVTIK